MFILGGLVHCADCDYRIDCKNPYITAKKHNKKTGHETHMEIYYGEIFKRKEELSEKEVQG